MSKTRTKMILILSGFVPVCVSYQYLFRDNQKISNKTLIMPNTIQK